jgi:hypothetical protein
MTVMRFMLTALVVGAFAIQAGVDLGLASVHCPDPNSETEANPGLPGRHLHPIAGVPTRRLPHAATGPAKPAPK